MRALSLLLLLLVSVPAAWALDAYQPTVRVLNVSAGEDRSVEIAISGQWPHSCHPELLETRTDGRVVLVRTVPDRSEECVAAVTPYQFQLDLDEAPTDPGVYQLRLFHGDRPEGIFSLYGFELFEVGRTDLAVTPETGIWWPRADGVHDTSGPGVGFALDFQRDQVTLMANMYADDGDPTWMIGHGRVRGRIASTDLMGFVGGQALFGDYMPPTAALESARALIEFEDRARATLWITAPIAGGPGILLQPIPIVRYVFAHANGATALRGQWRFVGLDDLPTLSLDPGARADGGQTFRDHEVGVQLDCEVDAYRADVLPRSCLLRNGEGEVLATFSDVGLNGMSGTDREGRRVRALRVGG